MGLGVVIAVHATSNVWFLFENQAQAWPGNNKTIFVTFICFEILAAFAFAYAGRYMLKNR